MTNTLLPKQIYWRNQRILQDAISKAYDEKDYQKVNILQERMDSFVDPDPDKMLTGDEGLLVFND